MALGRLQEAILGNLRLISFHFRPRLTGFRLCFGDCSLFIHFYTLRRSIDLTWRHRLLRKPQVLYSSLLQLPHMTQATLVTALLAQTA